MSRMSLVKWGSTITVGKLSGENGREVEDDRFGGNHDVRFNHSWRPIGPGKGWYWIPKGRLSMDLVYPASQADIRRFGHQARKTSMHSWKGDEWKIDGYAWMDGKTSIIMS